ncbi:hypothetical protein PoB_003230700 [Plakobranchus ocellatus]|uniref:CUT domain-containing protein n=1 Tax=Plakobranchus ocellatus TaxID=259542 RepID=A0AAV4AFX4_9GAST|nr:hypothetical protein PoB_003230700 [Plakobranchus ocellatus]
MLKDLYPVSTVNMHSLKASHIVSWYIDYLIHENEHLTQISRAFSLPVNLFHSDDFYFMESLKKKVHFPSLKFLTWMQQNLPSINVSAVDFTEGRPVSASAAPAAKSPTPCNGNNFHPANSGLSSSSVSSSASAHLTSQWPGQPSSQHPHPQHAVINQQQQPELASWQNKSRRDIIHDVFFYFQHRRVTCQN